MLLAGLAHSYTVPAVLRKRYSADSDDDGSDSDKASAGPQAASTPTRQRQTKTKKEKQQKKKKRKPVLPQQQLDAILDSDWARDRQGRQSLNRDRFFLAWFQIADQVKYCRAPKHCMPSQHQ